MGGPGDAMELRLCGGVGGGLPEAEDRAGGIDEEGDPAYADVGGLLDGLAAEGEGLVVGGFDVGDLDVGTPEAGRAGHGMLHEAAAGALRGLDDGVVVSAAGGHILPLPVGE